MDNILIQILENCGVATATIIVMVVSGAIVGKAILTIATVYNYKTKKEFWEDIFLPYYLYKEYKKLK